MRVLLADDHPLFRDGLRNLLESRAIDVVGEAINGRQAVEYSKRLRPDVVLMDLHMPELGGLEGTRLISAEQTDVKGVVLTASEDDATCSRRSRVAPMAIYSRTWIRANSSAYSTGSR